MFGNPCWFILEELGSTQIAVDDMAFKISDDGGVVDTGDSGNTDDSGRDAPGDTAEGYYAGGARCGCSSGSTGGGALMWLALPVLLLRRRR